MRGRPWEPDWRRWEFWLHFWGAQRLAVSRSVAGRIIEGAGARWAGLGLQRLDLPGEARPTQDPRSGRVGRRQGGDLQVRSRGHRARLSSLLRRTSPRCCRVSVNVSSFERSAADSSRPTPLSSQCGGHARDSWGDAAPRTVLTWPSAMETHLIKTRPKSTSCASLGTAQPRGRVVAAAPGWGER